MQIDCKTSVIIEAIEKFGGEARVVGGCVRDSILQRKVHDIDLATNLLPNQTIKALELYNIKAVPTGIRHGTITAILDRSSFEVTTLRHDVKCNGRYAKVEFTTTWRDDASRRDFMFNALYADKSGNIYDYFGGIEDLKARRLTFIGKAEDRIKEDFLRILRAFRFHAKICIGDLSDEILDVCKKYSHMIENLSGERIREEVFKLLECDNPVSALKGMQKSNVLQRIIPKEVKCDVLSSQLLFKEKPTIKKQSYLCKRDTKKIDALMKLALLLRTTKDRLNLGKDVSKFLRLSNKQKKRLLFLLSSSIGIDLSEKEQRKYISLFGRELYCDLIRICCIESGADIDKYILLTHMFDIPKFPLSGDDLITVGYKPGRSLGNTLEKLRQFWEESSCSLTKEKLILHAKSLI